MEIKSNHLVISILVIMVLSFIGIYLIIEEPETVRAAMGQTIGAGELDKFSSCDELKTFVKTNVEVSTSRDLEWGDVLVAPLTGPAATIGTVAVPMVAAGSLGGFAAPSMMMQESAAVATTGLAGKSAEAGEYSTTNIQVEGVDEADIVKNDGKYIYVVSGKKIVIVDAFPPENAKILSKIELSDYPIDIFINKDKLIVFGSTGGSYYGSGTFIKVYDISDRGNPQIRRDVSLDGSYFNSRMIGDYVYIIVNQPIYYQAEEDIKIPEMKVGTQVRPLCDCDDIYYFDIPDRSYRMTIITSVNTQNDNEDIKSKTFLTGDTQNIFVSLNNIYLTQTTHSYVPEMESGEKTVIHKIAIKGGDVEYKAEGGVPGNVLNQFSMDEFNGYFRIATTIGHVSRSGGGSTNNVYVLDDNLNTVGRLEDLAPGERIYSARFMGNKGYLVTFRKVDPLFVIDLSDPFNPKVLGKLKIPGYSDYLHPYDENHIIGVGKETIAAESGDFSWYQGVKISLFDVSDVSMPKEVSKLEIGDRGTDSYVLTDHKAFLFSRSKNLLVIPIKLAEINEEEYPGGVPAHGQFVWQGAYVIDISLENGLVVRGRVGHADDESLLKSGYYYSSPYAVERSLYMDDVLYTISKKMIKMNDLDDLGEINKVDLPYESGGYYPTPYR
ncbi:MAG: hypothetical protein GTN36_06130 [Candidatus Aenigmarchaeota archaeon]|nr:hypothetical protein [Candidatus Aenigmarchaeota archaeon]